MSPFMYILLGVALGFWLLPMIIGMVSGRQTS